MLPKKNRIKKESEIKKVFKEGKSKKEGFLILKTIKGNFKESRFGFIVSKKIAKKSSVRNRIKRQLRAIVQLKIKKIKPGTDNLIIALSGIENNKFGKTKEDLEKILIKAKLLND